MEKEGVESVVVTDYEYNNNYIIIYDDDSLASDIEPLQNEIL